MPPRRCCCIACEIGDDDFNRANANPPSGSWHEISGEFEILGNTLNTITPGVLATTICHPSAYALGSYVADMTLIGMSDGSVATWEVWVGDPAAPAYKVRVTHNSGTSQATLSLFDAVGLVHAETYSGVTTNQTLKICWAPGMMISAFLGGQNPHIDDCTAAAGAACYTVDMVSVGGFSFADGRFDDWTYQVHYIENQNCEACSCFCWQSKDDYSCFPETLTLTFESVGADAATFPDITLTQSFNDPSVPWPNKTEGWNSGIYNCGSPVGAEFTFRFLCGRPVSAMSLIPLDNLWGNPPGGQIVWSWVSGTDPFTSERHAITGNSTCDPLSIEFPQIKINSAFPGSDCSIDDFPDGASQPYCSSLSGNCYATEPDIRFIPRIVV